MLKSYIDDVANVRLIHISSWLFSVDQLLPASVHSVAFTMMLLPVGNNALACHVSNNMIQAVNNGCQGMPGGVVIPATDGWLPEGMTSSSSHTPVSS